MRLAFLLILPVCLAAGQTAQSAWQEFPNLELPLSNTEGVTIRIRTDLGIVAPRYQQWPRDNERWVDHLTSGVPRAKESVRALVARTGWGHVAPYLYGAVYHALGRMYNGMSSSPALADGSALIPRARLRPGVITLRVYGNRSDYERDARAAGNPEAFYNRKAREVSICIPRGWFETLESLQNWRHENPDAALLAMEEYLNWLVLRNTAHELTHEVQDGVPPPAYSTTLVREGTAMFLMDNVMEREEMVKLSEAAMRLVQKPSNAAWKACMEVPGDAPRAGASAWGIQRIREAARLVRATPEFSLTSLLRDQAFFSGDSATIGGRYSVAYLAARFLTRLNRDYLAQWNAAVAAGGLEPSARLDAAFRQFAESWAAGSWDNPKAEELRAAAGSTLSTCLNGSLLQPAYDAGRAMIAYNPRHSMGWIYTGDVFWRAGKAFIALDAYYLPARAMIRQGDPAMVLAQSRIADAHESLGRIREARQEYLDVASMSYPDNLEITVSRGRLKAAYYTLTESENSWATDSSARRLNRYVQMYQNQPAQENFRAQCGGGSDFACMARLWRRQYETIAATMKAELGTPR